MNKKTMIFIVLLVVAVISFVIIRDNVRDARARAELNQLATEWEENVKKEEEALQEYENKKKEYVNFLLKAYNDELAKYGEEFKAYYSMSSENPTEIVIYFDVYKGSELIAGVEAHCKDYGDSNPEFKNSWTLSK